MLQWLAKEDQRPEYYKNRVNAGLHVINPKVLRENPLMEIVNKSIVEGGGLPYKIDLDRMILKPLANTGRMYCYDSPEYVKDMGTPDRYRAVIKDFQKGIIVGKNLSNPQKAIFLDRDGTINKYVGFLRNAEEFELIDGVSEAIKIINSLGFLCIVITNQPVIARGEVTVDELNSIHNKLETMLGHAGGFLNGIYYCPHHPHKGYAGEVIELKIDCNCRKPKPGLLLEASKDFNINLSQSFMVGDSESDVIAGKNAGCKTVLITEDITLPANYGQDYSVCSLLEFVKNHLCTMQ
ncbi:D,D-heptose 1,7-bisphosphate phosphatase [Enterococcus faecium]|uniref:D,D-heptose 1,7-bisphosphate phosphatase n=1 Tax=Enterococcus faecium TaxID=1352 RepID=A0ABD7LS13_ENTFC|nr:D,D-heptose 1,7-bisphosphate phosphatase [Enterococcus faecium]